MMWSDASVSKLTVVLAVIHVSLKMSVLYRKIMALDCLGLVSTDSLLYLLVKREERV